MIAHVVLFRPRASLSEAERTAFVLALEAALREIPSIARALVGRRVTLGRRYDAPDADGYPFAAILEFHSRDDLVAYLDHPAHQALGEHFYTASDAALALDFEILPTERLDTLLEPLD
jgi:hypothetical protein